MLCSCYGRPLLNRQLLLPRLLNLQQMPHRSDKKPGLVDSICCKICSGKNLFQNRNHRSFCRFFPEAAEFADVTNPATPAPDQFFKGSVAAGLTETVLAAGGFI